MTGTDLHLWWAQPWLPQLGRLPTLLSASETAGSGLLAFIPPCVPVLQLPIQFTQSQQAAATDTLSWNFSWQEPGGCPASSRDLQ